MEYAPNVPLKGVAFSYLAPSAKSDDAAAENGGRDSFAGRSSRLYQSLVYQQQVATSAKAGADMQEDAGLFTF
jgi:zinc protease